MSSDTIIIGNKYTVISGDFVKLFISSDQTNFISEKKFPRSLTVEELKNKLELIVGARTGSMKISVFDQNNVRLGDLDNVENSSIIGSLSFINNDYRIHITDSSQPLWNFDSNGTNIEKYIMSPDVYDRKENTLRNFLRNNKLGRYNKEQMAEIVREKEADLKTEWKLAAEMALGDRCEVEAIPGVSLARRGTIRFLGEVSFSSGVWVGVEYDEPVGKNDGSVGKKRYFECKPNYGGMVKIGRVHVGNFEPEFADELILQEEDEM